MREACDKQVALIHDKVVSLEKQLAESHAKVANAEQLHHQKMTQKKEEEAEKLRREKMGEKIGRANADVRQDGRGRP